MVEESAIRNPKSAIAFFPGQGSQAVGMGKDLFDNFAAAREVFEEADDALGFSLSEMCFAGDEADLQLTANTQPAILTTSVAAYPRDEERRFSGTGFVAGHSLGEYSALVAAAFWILPTRSERFESAARICRKRFRSALGRWRRSLGLMSKRSKQGCAEAAQGQVCSPANINSPSQVVIAGKYRSGRSCVRDIEREGCEAGDKAECVRTFSLCI